jgi:hypothetical protein
MENTMSPLSQLVNLELGEKLIFGPTFYIRVIGGWIVFTHFTDSGVFIPIPPTFGVD